MDAPDPADDDEAREHLEEGGQQLVAERLAARRVTCTAAQAARRAQ